jgi:glycerate dehydrogenase
VPEHTFALMLALRRSILPYRQSVIEGRWQQAAQFCYFDYPISDLGGSTLGIIGHGTLGQSVGKIAEAFGMTVLTAGRRGATELKPGQTAFDEVLKRSDVITLHCPLTPDTRGVIGIREFALMERKPLLINTGRGGLVDELALEKALDAGQISGAGFDVTDGEPPAASSPMMRIASRENVILTPHVAWASREAIQALANQLIENIELFLAGTPRNLVG